MNYQEIESYIGLLNEKYRKSRLEYDLAYDNLVNHLKVCDSTEFCVICSEVYEKCDKAALNMKQAHYSG